MIVFPDEGTSPWFPRSINPAYVGVYQIRYVHYGITHYRYSFWNGQEWCLCCGEAKTAQVMSYARSTDLYRDDSTEWRGLSEKPA
ncbi:hypothetical protein [Curvibacter phage PCA1]|nr:hypothetical protein [Curvibacter phage PCA1]